MATKRKRDTDEDEAPTFDSSDPRMDIEETKVQIEMPPDHSWCPRCKAPAVRGKPGVKYNCAQCHDVY